MMISELPGAQGVLRPLRRLLSRLDALVDRFYGWRYNPLYQSGAIAVALFLVLLATGLYLLLYYRIGSPHASVERIASQTWTGAWIRSMHRYASDAAMVAIGIHALRMFLRGRSWGPRALAWLSGLVLVSLFLLIGWTGFVMVWDVHGLILAAEGARILDALPIFTEPVARAFIGEGPMPGAFFFLNYFLHIAVPLGVALFLYLHVARLSRPTLLPPKALGWGLVAGLFVLAVAWPAPMHPAADPGVVPSEVPLNLFYGFWIPLTRLLPPGWVWLLGLGVVALVASVPLWSRPRKEAAPEPSSVDPRSCTGCEQCFHDCPYEAISMVPRHDGRETLLALVDRDLCVSCGICAGSCAPMGVGPPRRTGKDQIQRVRAYLNEVPPGPTDVILIACSLGAGEVGELEEFSGARVYPVQCAGNLHTSVVEFLIRAGAGGVMVAACPDRDCWNREGPQWTRERLFHDREAELKPRVDRARVTFVQAGAGDRWLLAEEVRAFQEHVRSLIPPEAEADVQIGVECEVPEHTEDEMAEGLKP